MKFNTVFKENCIFIVFVFRNNSFMKVPVDYLQDYKEAFGSSCEYISAWNPSESGDDTKPVTPCDAPTVNL